MVPVHANNTGHWRAEKFPVAQDCSCMSRRLFARDSHLPVDLSSQFAAENAETTRAGAEYLGADAEPRRSRRRRGGPGMLQMRTPYATAGYWSSMAHTEPRRVHHSSAPAAPVG